jgi:SAM-dependent methyltransferase
VDGVPHLLSRDPRFGQTPAIVGAYDSFYGDHSHLWENQGRTPEFIRYLSSFLDGFPASRSLEIGCGEGYLLASREKGEKFGVDLSIEAIRQAKTRAEANFSLALAERLPFPADYFDQVSSIGVMEHFLDTEGALHEIRRVLKPGGHYVNLVHVDATFGERLGWLFSHFLYPRPRPIELLRHLGRKVRRRIFGRKWYPRQPIQNRYTTQGGKEWLARCGFTVVDIVHRRKDPDLPLWGPWVVIYVAQKP